MFKNKKKVLALTISALILIMSLGTTGYAQTIQSTLKAQFVSFKIMLNGSQVTPKDASGNTVQPLLVNGTTYLPIRAFGDLFDKSINFDNSLKQISITNKPNSEVENLKAQIREKDNQILLLQAQLTAKAGNRSLSVVEDELNDNYEDYEGLDVDITLSGTKSKITVKVDIGSKSKWNKLSTSKQNRLLQNIADDLDDEYDDPSISGTVKAGSSTISSFTVNSSGTVKISSNDLDELEDDLNSEFDELGDIDDLNIVLDGDEDQVTFTVEIAYEDFEDEWDALKDNDILFFMEDIKYAIEDAFYDSDYDLKDYRNANVSGTIVNTDDDNDKMASITKSGKFSRDSSYK
ncbi:MAG: hypothetical protein ACOX47_09165 [Bacillota bacterium]|jgi:hypothetical protein